MTRTEFRPIRPYGAFPSVQPQPFDPRSNVFIPDRSIHDAQMGDGISPRHLRLIGAKVYASAVQSIADDAAAHARTFNTVAFDTASMFSNSADTLTVPFSGMWLISALAEFAANATGRRRMRLLVNGSTDVSFNVDAASAGTTILTLLGIPRLMTAGDTLAYDLLQNSGGALDANGSEANCFLSAIYMGAI